MKWKISHPVIFKKSKKKKKAVVKKTDALEIKTDIAIEISNLSFRYRPHFEEVLKKVNLKIKCGEYVTIIGHNGSGKSTLAKLIMGVLRYSQGAIKILGYELNSKSASRILNYLGVVFQNPDNQFIGSTVEDDVAFGLENRRMERKFMRPRIIEVLKKVKMEDFLEHEPLMLSGGQKQKVAIASALALEPEIIIFDESTSMLDPKGKAEIKQIILELRAKKNQTILSITHDMDEILQADKVVVLNDGKVTKVGTPAEILKDIAYLKSIGLDAPFLYHVWEAMQNEGIKFQQTLNSDTLIKEIKGLL